MHGSIELCDAPVLRWGKRAYTYPGENLNTGNRCGHDPQNLATFRLALPTPGGGYRIKILEKLIEKAQAYFLDPTSVPLLTYLAKKKKKDGDYRQNRSEAREGLSLVMCAIFAALDLKSLRVGAYTPRGEFKNLHFNELASRAGLSRIIEDPENPSTTIEVASSRFWRAIAWLKKAGVIEVFEQYDELADGSKRGRPAIKTVNPKFLRQLGKFTQAAFKRARVKSSEKVTEYVNGATLSGVLSKDEDDQLARDLQQDAFRKQMSTAPVRKNQHPKTVARDNNTDALLNDYGAYTAALMAKIAKDLGRPIRGGAEGQRLWRQYGGLSEPEWQRKRAGQ